MEGHRLRNLIGITRYILVSFLVFSLLLSCGGARLRVAYGNYKFSQGEYGEASINYFRAMITAKDRSVLYYNLGNVYHALGETDSAANTLSRAVVEGEWDVLESRAHFNLANIHYELGEYKRAAEHYRASLVADPNDIESKINLELTLKRMSGVESEPGIEAQQEKPLKEPYENILRLIKRREVESWRLKKSSQETERDPAPVREDW
jgi:Ca-activated chloride channel family protein